MSMELSEVLLLSRKHVFRCRYIPHCSLWELKLENQKSLGMGLWPQLPESDPAATICTNKSEHCPR